MPEAHLEDRAVIAVAGPEARDFLQGLITNDMARVGPGKGTYAALLTPQGKILFDFLLTEGDQGTILVDCAAAARDALARRLAMYRLRAKVTIEPRNDLSVIAGWEGGNAFVYPDPRHEDLGARALVAGFPGGALKSDAYHERRLSLGIPEGSDFGTDRMFALDADLEELNAVDFNKGCYVGQELTARMKHRATSRKRLLPYRAEAEVPAGAAVRAGEREIGEVAATYGARGFALVRLDRWDEADAPVSAGSSPLDLIKPSWLFP